MTENNIEADIQLAEAVASEAGTAAAALGGEPGKIADAALQGVEAATNAVVADQAAGHHTAVVDAADALQAVLDKTPAAVADLMPADAQKAINAAEHASGLLATLRAAWRDVEVVFNEVKTIV